MSRTSRSSRAVPLAVVLFLALVLVGGCGTSTGDTPHVVVTPATSRMDEAVSIRVSGLKPASEASIQLRSVDIEGVTWTARALFVADQAGALDLDRAAPTSGSYFGASGMGLFTSLTPSPTENGYRWPLNGAATFEVEVDQGGKPVATTSIARVFWDRPPTTRTFSVEDDGFVGTYWKPSGVQRGPAVLVLGGSEGGDPSFSAAILAARGIPALSVAYFGAPGLPKELHDIALEYFDRPLRWLRSQPEVDPDRVWISGASRGSEAAALVAIERPGLVHGLLDLSPSSTVNCAYLPSTRQRCPGVAWTRGGKPVAHTTQWDTPTPTDEPDALIAIEKIDGPVLTLCGDVDQVWNSCDYTRAIQQRLQDHGKTFPRLALSYPDAGHAIDYPMPYEAFGPLPAGAVPTYGSTPTANDQARADAWPKVIAFVREAT